MARVTALPLVVARGDLARPDAESQPRVSTKFFPTAENEMERVTGVAL